MEPIVQSELFQQFGLLILFLYTMTPAIVFVPSELFLASFVATDTNPFLLIVIVGAGGFLGDMALYYLGWHGHKFLTKRKTAGVKANHWLHKYKHVVFLLPPFTSIVGDLIMVYAGIKHIPLKIFWMYLLSANIARAILAVVVVYGIIQMPHILNPIK